VDNKQQRRGEALHWQANISTGNFIFKRLTAEHKQTLVHDIFSECKEFCTVAYAL
jgi:hypothetical protein